MVNVAVPLPPALVAVTVYKVDGDTTDGVPLRAPVDVSKVNPDGTDGKIDQDVAVPPLAVGVTVVIETPFASVNELGE
jgi:hypothetical protein